MASRSFFSESFAEYFPLLSHNENMTSECALREAPVRCEYIPSEHP